MEIEKKSDKIRYSRYNIDPVGRIFFKDKRVFRGINEEYAGLCMEIFEKGLLRELIEKKFIVNTKIIDYKIGNYKIVLEHERVLATHPTEWSFLMVKDAIILLLKINNVCNKYGFQLKDGHLWNLAFCKNRPIFLDFGSITHHSDQINEAFKAEISITVIALILWSMGEDIFAQKIIENCVTFYKRTLPASSIWDSEMIKNALNIFFDSVNKDDNFASKKEASLAENEKNIKDLILSQISPEFIKNKIIHSKAADTYWANYQSDFFDSGNEDRFSRFGRIFEIIQNYSPEARSILDLAGNIGGMLYYIEQKTDRFKSLVNVDYDENAIENSYQIFKKVNSNIESYVLNFMLPTRDDTRDIFKSDIVLALAITHHLVLTQKYSLDFIFESIESYADKYVYVEFMPLGLYGGDEKNTPPIPDWYNKEWFRNKFMEKFILLHEEQLEKNRIVFVGKIKK